MHSGKLKSAKNYRKYAANTPFRKLAEYKAHRLSLEFIMDLKQEEAIKKTRWPTGRFKFKWNRS